MAALPLVAIDALRYELDARGTLCPVPVLLAGQAARRLPPGAEVTVLADDPGALPDLEAWCAANRHDWLGGQAQGGTLTLRFRRR